MLLKPAERSFCPISNVEIARRIPKALAGSFSGRLTWLKKMIIINIKSNLEEDSFLFVDFR